MRRLILTLLLSLAASASHAGTMYYQDLYTDAVYAVPDTGGTPQLVVADGEISVNVALICMTRHNHPGSNGQAIFAYGGGILYLVYRDASGAVVSKVVTALENDPVYRMSPGGSPALAQDDSFFSFRASREESGIQWSTIWRLNVTVDEALDPNYVPPMTFDDPRLQLVVDNNPAIPGISENPSHSWSPDGTRMAYMDRWQAADGTPYVSVRVKEMWSGNLDPEADDRLFDVPLSESNWHYDIQWSPVDDRIINTDASGNMMAFYADTPGLRTWIALARQTKIKTQSVTERVESSARWRPDGQLIGASYGRTTVTKRSTITERYPAVWTPSGWPAKLVQSNATSDRVKILGWIP